MLQYSQTTSVRTGHVVCKRPGPGGSDNRRLPLLLALGATLLLPACRVSQAPRTISLESLEQAPTATASAHEHLVVADPQSLRELCLPLGPRLGLIQVRSVGQWELLARAAPQLSQCPDLRRGILVGLICWAGTPLDGRWPIRLNGVQVRDGAGLVRADFHGGTYLPDGAAFLELAHVPGLMTVLVVNVNGATFYPE